MSDSFYPLTPQEAADKFKACPGDTFFALPDLMRDLEMTWPELKAELMAGRLRAIGRKVTDGYDEVMIPGTNMLAWMATAQGRRYWDRRFAEKPSAR